MLNNICFSLERAHKDFCDIFAIKRFAIRLAQPSSTIKSVCDLHAKPVSGETLELRDWALRQYSHGIMTKFIKFEDIFGGLK